MRAFDPDRAEAVRTSWQAASRAAVAALGTPATMLGPQEAARHLRAQHREIERRLAEGVASMLGETQAEVFATTIRIRRFTAAVTARLPSVGALAERLTEAEVQAIAVIARDTAWGQIAGLEAVRRTGGPRWEYQPGALGLRAER